MQFTAIVTHARVVAHLNQNVGGISENHWSIYLLLQDSTSVRMNVTVAYGETNARLEWTTYNYQLTNSALHHWDFEMAQGVTVQMVYDLVYYYRRDRYYFSGGGSGCRYWCYTIMQDLEGSRYVAVGSYANLWPQLQYRYSRSRAPVALNWVEGEFYTIETVEPYDARQDEDTV